MTAANLKIVHESEVQRQHVRVEVPGSVKIGNNLYKIKDISAGGFSVSAPEKISESQSGKVEFIFPFAGYALQFIGTAKLVQDDRARRSANFRFVDLDASQISIISHIVRARMAGALIDGGEIIHAAGRNNFVELKNRAQNENGGWRTTLRRVLPTILFSVVGLGALAFVLGNAYENSSILKSYQGVVEGGTITVRSYAEGNVRLLLSDAAEKVAKGQPLAVIERPGMAPQKQPPAPAAPGQPPVAAAPELTIYSPCDCNIQQRLVQNGEFKAVGEPLFTLVSADAMPYITAIVEPEKAHHLRLQDDVNVRVAGEGGFIAGHIMDIGIDSLDKPYTKVKIKPEKRMSLDMLGRPVYVEFALYK